MNQKTDEERLADLEATVAMLLDIVYQWNRRTLSLLYQESKTLKELTDRHPLPKKST